MKRILFIFFAIVFTFSCGKKTQLTQTKISFFGSSAMLASGPQMNGGIVVVGHLLDDSEKFSIGLQNASDEQILDLKKGKWEFAAVGWEGEGGGGLFTGINRCAYSGIVDLNSNETAVTFNLDFATCANIPNHGAIVSHPDYLYQTGLANQFKPITLHSCNVLTATPACNAVGLTRSFKIIVEGMQDGSMGRHPLPPLVGSCQNITATLATSLKIPVGNRIGGVSENIIKSKVLAFANDNCSGTPIEFRFDNSMYEGLNYPNLKAAIHTTGANITDLYIEHNSTTVSSNIGFNPFGYGKDGEMDLVAYLFSAGQSSYQQTQKDFGSIKAIDVTSKEIIIPMPTNPNFIGQNIGLYDEIMWYVNSESTDGSCGGFFPGLYGLAQVTGSVDTTTTVDSQTFAEKRLTLTPPFGFYKNNDGTGQSLTLPNSSLSGCSIQIVRVPHYRHFTVTNSVSYKALPFIETSQIGGILPIKISNGLTIDSGKTFTIDASATGRSSPVIYPTCPVWARCAKMAAAPVVGQPSITTGTSGGIVLTWINQINTYGGNSLKLTVTGANNSSGIGGSGGHIENKIGFINNSAADSYTYFTSGGTGNTEANTGSPGKSYFQFCQNSQYSLDLHAGINNQNCNF